MDRQAEKDKTERGTGLGGRTREEIAKWNQMTALRFQTERRPQTSPVSPSGAPKAWNELLTASSVLVNASYVFVARVQMDWGTDETRCTTYTADKMD